MLIGHRRRQSLYGGGAGTSELAAINAAHSRQEVQLSGGGAGATAVAIA